MENGLGNKEIFAKNLKYYLEKKQVTQKDVCKILNFKETTFSEWVRAKSYPRIDKIEMLANYFNIEKSDLIEDKTLINKSSPNIEIKDILSTATYMTYGGKELSDKEKKQIRNILKTILEE
jgi:Helix-turn-helix.|nr:MAG TPA: Repressor protein CI [Caudoviricetes sp.]